MKQRMIYCTCPHCGHVFQIKRDTLSIVGMNSIIDERIRNGTHFTHMCSKCHEPFYMMHPFLYRNPEKKYIVLLTNQEHIDNLPQDETIIKCKNVPQFLLAAACLEQGLNLSLVYSIKRQLDQKYKETVKFESYDVQNHCLWFIVGIDRKAVVLKREQEAIIYDKIEGRK